MIINEFPCFCTECKKHVEEIEELLFVEDGSTKGFCSEDCIEDFYSGNIKYFERKILEAREAHNILNEDINFERDDEFLLEETVRNPNEIWCITSDLKEEIFFYLKIKEDFNVVVICSRFNSEPSFIYSIVKTKSHKFLGEFRIGEKIDLQKEAFDNQEILDEDIKFLETLDNKKSQLLGDLLNRRLDSDINFEHFSEYEYCFGETMSSPDEIYELKDREGDVVYHYLKTFLDPKLGSFFYIIVALKKLVQDQSINVYPILSFPTSEMELFNEFRSGVCTMGTLKN